MLISPGRIVRIAVRVVRTIIAASRKAIPTIARARRIVHIMLFTACQAMTIVGAMVAIPVILHRRKLTLSKIDIASMLIVRAGGLLDRSLGQTYLFCFVGISIITFGRICAAETDELQDTLFDRVKSDCEFRVASASVLRRHTVLV
jgi:hypothetical protein